MPGGLHPVDANSPTRKWLIPATDGSVVGIGDAVIKTGDANDAEVVTGCSVYAVGHLNECIRATSGDANLITGVVTSIDANPDSRNGPNSRAASTATVVTVTDHAKDPNILYYIDADNIMVNDDVGLNTNLTGSAGVDAATGFATVLADADAAADQSAQLLIVGMKRDPEAAMTDADVTLIVKINQQTEGLNVIGIA